MRRLQVYLILIVAFAGWSAAYPRKNEPYVVTWTGDTEAHGLLGSKLCTRGPSYWCHNITQASQCHAMQHCIKHVWENPKEKLPADNDSVCDVCLDMVKQARDQLLSNETQDELRQVLEGSCNLIPLKIVSKECRELADDFIPELIDALTSRMDPQMVCHVSGLCNSARIDEMLAEMKEIDGPKEIKPLNPANFDTCPKCEYYVGEYTNALKKLAKKDVRVRLLDYCGYLGSYSESCRAAVNHELDAIYNYIQNDMKPKDLCSLVGLCQSDSLHRVTLTGSQQQAATSVRVWQPPKTKDDDLECDFCKQLVTSVRQWLIGNNTMDEFKTVLEALCKQTGRYKDECRNLVDQYAVQFYDTIVHGMDPAGVCQSLTICPSGLRRVQLAKDDGPVWTILATPGNKVTEDDSSSEEDGTIPLTRLMPGERLTGDDERNAIRRNGEVRCQFCEYALQNIQEYLDDAKTEDEIRTKVDTFCANHLPNGFAEQCKMLVQEYGDALVALLAQELDPSQICVKLRLCPVPTTTTVSPVTAVGQPVKDILPTCELCTFTIEKLIHLVGKNMTKESIDRAMENICTHLPQNMHKKCTNFMLNYGDQVAEMILIYGTSHGVCAALHLCIMEPVAPTPHKIVIESQLPLDRYLPQTVAVNRVAQIEQVEDDSRRCVMCEFVISTLDQRLQDNATEEQIKMEVEHICTYLPKTIQSRCQNFVETYGEQIIQYLSQDLDPSEVCQQIGLCQPQKKPEAIRDLNMDRCQLCMLVSDYLSTLVEEEKKDRTIEQIAAKTCALVPKSYRQECNTMIEDYGAYLLNILSTETDKGKACAQIQLCPSLTGPATEAEDNSLDGIDY